MENNITFGLDEESAESREDAGVIDITKEKTGKLPFATWTVGGINYRLKLSTSAICQLEKKYGRNILLLITDDGLPPVSVMLTVIQAALAQYSHGITFPAVQDMYDTYVSEGGDQMKLLSDVVMPTLGVSGFFTEKQMEVMTAEIQNMDSTL